MPMRLSLGLGRRDREETARSEDRFGYDPEGVTRRMKTVWVGWIAASVIAVGLVTGGAASLGRSEVASVLADRILPELAIESDFVAFLHPALLAEEDELAPYAPTPIPEEIGRLPHLIPYDVSGPTWFVWIDLDPYARYAHDTLYVLIDANDGTYVVHRESWWPVLNGTSLWVDEDDYWRQERWIASSLSCGIPRGTSSAICEPELPGSDFFDWALVINGWSPGQPDEAGLAMDAAGACEAFNRLGMRVSILRPGDASPEALEAFVVRLFTEIPLYHCCDRLYFYIAAHASPGALWIGGQRLPSAELARILTTPGDTYVPSRVYVLLEAGYGGSFLPDLTAHSNINRVWTASAAGEPAYGDLDPDGDPNPEDAGGEWTSSLLAAMERLLAEDAVAARATEYGREYIPLNLAGRELETMDAAVSNGLSAPAGYVLTESMPEYLLTAIEYLARYDHAHHASVPNLEETIAEYEATPCLEFLWFLHRSARHDPIPAPTPEFSYRILKGYARDVAHSDWWEHCDLFWEIFVAPDGE